MTDIGGEDRVVGLEPVDGFSFESDGAPITELAVDAPDSLAEAGSTVAEQAIGERSWRFGHVIVDEAQDLTPMQWRVIARRTSGGSLTVVGDLAQRSIGPPGRWEEHLPPSLSDFAYRELTVNYRSPAEINDLASAVLRELAPELAASRSIRAVGHPPTVETVEDLERDLLDVVRSHRRSQTRGRMAVIGPESLLERSRARDRAGSDAGPAAPVVQWLDPWQAKGLEFDSVVLVEPAALLDEPHGLSLLYVAITRTTDHLHIVHQQPLPSTLAENLPRFSD